jgi:hypothetical protein
MKTYYGELGPWPDRILEAPSIDPQGTHNYGPCPSRARSSVVEHLTFNQEVVRSIRTGLTRSRAISDSYYPKLQTERASVGRVRKVSNFCRRVALALRKITATSTNRESLREGCIGRERTSNVRTTGVNGALGATFRTARNHRHQQVAFIERFECFSLFSAKYGLPTAINLPIAEQFLQATSMATRRIETSKAAMDAR